MSCAYFPVIPSFSAHVLWLLTSSTQLQGMISHLFSKFITAHTKKEFFFPESVMKLDVNILLVLAFSGCIYSYLDSDVFTVPHSFILHCMVNTYITCNRNHGRAKEGAPHGCVYSNGACHTIVNI